MASSVDYLDEDTIVPNGQRFALVSFVGPEQRQKNDVMGMKIRGCFATQEEAASHVKKLQAFDGSVDIFMLEVGKWVPIPPNAEDIEDVQYQEQYLQELMKGYRESQLKAKEIFQQRAEAVKKQGVDANLLPGERLPPPPEDEAGPSGSKDDEAGPSTAGDVFESMK